MKRALPISPMGRVFATVAFVEALTWAGLLIGMYFKYHAADPTPIGVRVCGPLHGFAFMAYVVVTALAALFERLAPDVVVVLGDRIEAFAAASAASIAAASTVTPAMPADTAT